MGVGADRPLPLQRRGSRGKPRWSQGRRGFLASGPGRPRRARRRRAAERGRCAPRAAAGPTLRRRMPQDRPAQRADTVAASLAPVQTGQRSIAATSTRPPRTAPGWVRSATARRQRSGRCAGPRPATSLPRARWQDGRDSPTLRVTRPRAVRIGSAGPQHGRAKTTGLPRPPRYRPWTARDSRAAPACAPSPARRRSATRQGRWRSGVRVGRIVSERIAGDAPRHRPGEQTDTPDALADCARLARGSRAAGRYDRLFRAAPKVATTAHGRRSIERLPAYEAHHGGCETVRSDGPVSPWRRGRRFIAARTRWS